MSNAKGSGKDNKLTQPAKVVAQTRSEANAISSQDLRQRAQKAVAMPASAVRAAMASAARGAVPAVRVAYDVLSRLLSFVETGHALDHSTLQVIKGKLDTASAGDVITKKTIGKFFDQITNLNDVVTRVVSYKRTYTEVARSTDLPAKTLTKAPRQDTARSADSRVKTIGKNKSEVITLPENFSKIVSFKRNPADIALSTDADKLSLTKPKADIALGTDAKATTLSKPKADTLSLAELKRLNLGKVANDISRASDSDKLKFTKAINDFVSAIHSAGVDYGFTNSEVNLSTISDVLTKLVTFVRVYQDTALLVESRKKTLTKGTQAQTSRATDRISKVATFNRSKADTSRAADSLSRIVSFNRTKADTARFTDVAGKYLTKSPFVELGRAVDLAKRTLTKRPSDTSRAADSFSRLVSFNRTFSSTATSTTSVDVFSSVKNYNRLRTEAVRSTDVFAKVVTFRRLPVDTARSLDIFRKVVTFRRLSAELLRAQEVFLRVVTYNRSKTDTSRATDLFVKVVTYRRLPNDTSRAMDLITAKYITKRLSDLIRASDVFLITGYNHPGSLPPNDISNLRDVFKKVVSFIRTFNDTIALQDSKQKSLSRTAGSTYRVWSDFNELIVDFDTTQTLDTFRTEWMTASEQVGKFYSKVANKTLTYYRNAQPLTDYNELTFAAGSSVTSTDPDFTTTAVFDQDQLFTFTESYTADSERALISDAVTRVYRAVRTFTDTALANEAVGKIIERTVGDIKSRIFDDFAELFYVSEFYSPEGGIGASVNVVNNYPTFTVSVVTPGTNYTVGQQFTVFTESGTSCTFQVATIDGNGGILSLTTPTGTPARVSVNVSYFTDYADLTFGTGILDQDLAQYNVLTYAYPGPDTLRVGPQSSETKRSVWNQEMQFTLKERADGDKVSYSDSNSKFITKDARRYLPQGVFEDFAELTFGLGAIDQELSQYLNKQWPESVSTFAVSSVATLGPTKRNRDTFYSTDAKAFSLTKGTRVDTAASFDNIRSGTTGLGISKSVGEWANRTWRDYAEISGFAFSALAEMPVDYEGRYELIITPDTVGKVTTKPLHFEYYVWRDFNELSFGTTRDEEITLSWYRDDASDISRMMDRETKVLGKAPVEPLTVPDTFPKTISKGVGNTTQNDALINNPEYIPYLSWFDELLTPQYPDYKIDKVTSSDAKGSFISKVILGTGAISRFFDTGYDTTNYDESVLTYGVYGSDNNTFPNVKFVSYLDEFINTEFEEVYRTPYGSDSAYTVDVFSKLSTFIRTFNEDIRANDYFLLSKNGEAYTNEYLPVISKTSSALDKIEGRSIIKVVGDVKSAISLWSDFLDLQVFYELAQYYEDPTDSRIDTGKSLDSASRQFNKRGGRVYSILNVFDEELYYDEYLQQIFSTDYVTEIVIPQDVSTKTIQPNKSEIITLPETFGKFFSKDGVGDTIVDDWFLYSPLYINYLSDLEDSIRAQYPPRRIDQVRPASTKAMYYTKAAGMDAVLKWYTNFDYLTFDETNTTEGVYENRNNTFAQTKFVSYLDEIIYEFTEEFFPTSFRQENLTAVDDLFRRVLFNRTTQDIANPLDAKAFQLNKPKDELTTASQTNAIQYIKPAGTNYTIWRDYVDLVPDQDLTQQYDSVKFEYIRVIETYVNKLTKGKNDPVRSTDSRTKVFGKGNSETQLAREIIGKYVTKPYVGDTSLTAYYDSYEIYSYDETLLTYGETRTTKFDTYKAVDTLAKTYTVTPGNYRTKIWSDYNDLEYYNEIANYWPPYVTELLATTDSVTRSLNKGISDSSRMSESGIIRKYDSGAYVIDTSPYFASDYTEEGVTTSTF